MLNSGSRDVGPDVLESCRRGDRDALRAVYDAYKDRVYSIALYFFHGDADTAHDVTQQVFLKLIGAIRQYKGEASFPTWLYRLVVNACLDRSRRLRRVARSADAATLDAIPDGAISHDEALARTETARSVQAAVASLPPKLRAAILLRYFDDLSYAEMAVALGCSIGTVSSRLGRGHRLLAQKLSALREAVRE